MRTLILFLLLLPLSVSISFENMPIQIKGCKAPDGDLIIGCSKACSRVGQCARVGYCAGANSDYHEDDSIQDQRNVSIRLNKLGDTQLQLGKPQAALEAYQQSLKIRQRLASADLSNTQAQRDLSVSYYKLGQVEETLQNPAKALQWYQQALTITKILAAQDTANQQIQDELAYLQSLVDKLTNALDITQ